VKAKDLEKSKFIKVLEYTCSREFFTEEEIFKELDLSSDEWVRNVRDNMTQQGTVSDKKWTVGQDAFFRYLEYLELKEARQSSKEARVYAIIAIIISIVTMLLK